MNQNSVIIHHVPLFTEMITSRIFIYPTSIFIKKKKKNTTTTTESEEELKSLLMRVKEGS